MVRKRERERKRKKIQRERERERERKSVLRENHQGSYFIKMYKSF